MLPSANQAFQHYDEKTAQSRAEKAQLSLLVVDQAFQQWAFDVEALHWHLKGVEPLEPLADSVAYKRPRVTLSSRPIRLGFSFYL